MKVPNTITDKRWARIQRGANKTQAREGGMFGDKAQRQRKLFAANLRKKNAN